MKMPRRVGGKLQIPKFLLGLGLSTLATFSAPESRAQTILGIQKGSEALVAISGPGGQNCQVQWAEELTPEARWRHLATVVLSNSAVALPDPDWKTNTSRYYRAVETPAANMVCIPSGAFVMGDAFSEGDFDEIPTDFVSTDSVFMDRSEVSNKKMRDAMQWAYERGKIKITSNDVINLIGQPQKLVDLDAAGSELRFSNSVFSVNTGKSEFPCVRVTWFGAAAYCNYRSEMQGFSSCYNLTNWTCDWTADGYRLPTEAEWEKAARGGWEGYRYPWGNAFHSSLANCGTVGGPVAVGNLSCNDNGLHDAAGNVWEWVNDWYHPAYYSSRPATNPTGPLTGSFKVARGGSFYTQTTDARVANRGFSEPGLSFFDAGFRCVIPAK
jgi:formylglycine-generating enzyme required for sulfatase activity